MKLFIVSSHWPLGNIQNRMRNPASPLPMFGVPPALTKWSCGTRIKRLKPSRQIEPLLETGCFCTAPEGRLRERRSLSPSSLRTRKIIDFYHRRSRMVNMWYFRQKKILGAEDPVLPLLTNFIFLQQKIGRSSVANNLDADDSVLFYINKSFFWQQKICELQFPTTFINKKLTLEAEDRPIFCTQAYLVYKGTYIMGNQSIWRSTLSRNSLYKYKCTTCYLTPTADGPLCGFSTLLPFTLFLEVGLPVCHLLGEAVDGTASCIIRLTWQLSCVI